MSSKIPFNECHGFIALVHNAQKENEKRKKEKKTHSPWQLPVFRTSFVCCVVANITIAHEIWKNFHFFPMLTLI